MEVSLSCSLLLKISYRLSLPSISHFLGPHICLPGHSYSLIPSHSQKIHRVKHKWWVSHLNGQLFFWNQSYDIALEGMLTMPYHAGLPHTFRAEVQNGSRATQSQAAKLCWLSLWSNASPTWSLQMPWVRSRGTSKLGGADLKSWKICLVWSRKLQASTSWRHTWTFMDSRSSCTSMSRLNGRTCHWSKAVRGSDKLDGCCPSAESCKNCQFLQGMPQYTWTF